MPSRRSLERAADEILLKDGRVYHQGFVRTSRAQTLNERQAEREQVRRHRKAAHRKLMDDYHALPRETRLELRERYQAANPDKRGDFPSWNQWLAAQLQNN